MYSKNCISHLTVKWYKKFLLIRQKIHNLLQSGHANVVTTPAKTQAIKECLENADIMAFVHWPANLTFRSFPQMNMSDLCYAKSVCS